MYWRPSRSTRSANLFPYTRLFLSRGELRELLCRLKAMGVPEARYAINLSIARGLDYYTGMVYETTLDAWPKIGSICSGGRYDNLASHYTDRKSTRLNSSN